MLYENKDCGLTRIGYSITIYTQVFKKIMIDFFPFHKKPPEPHESWNRWILKWVALPLMYWRKLADSNTANWWRWLNERNRRDSGAACLSLVPLQPAICWEIYLSIFLAVRHFHHLCGVNHTNYMESKVLLDINFPCLWFIDCINFK
jgi:hypothetical protein